MPDLAFPDTRWSLIVSSRGQGDSARRALEELCNAYWYPLYGFARSMGISPNDAEDFNQSFFLVLIESELLNRVSPDGGKLRSYLIGALKNYIRAEWRKASRQKRGSGNHPLSFDSAEAEARLATEASRGSNPERDYERRWAITLLGRALERLGREYERRGEGELFAALSPHLDGVGRGDEYRELSASVGKSEGALRVAMFRLRKRYRELVREEIAQTVSSNEEVDAEIDSLFAALVR